METTEKCKCDYCDNEVNFDDSLSFNLPNGDAIVTCDECSQYVWETHYWCDDCKTFHPFEIGYKGNFFHYSEDFICPKCAYEKCISGEYFLHDAIYSYEPIIFEDYNLVPGDLSKFDLFETFPGETLTSDNPKFVEVIQKMQRDGMWNYPVIFVRFYDWSYSIKMYVQYPNEIF